MVYPIGITKGDVSIAPINSSGGMMPLSGCFQRMRASNPYRELSDNEMTG